MADKKKREAEWAEAKRVCPLNAETVRMAKELGLNPRKLMKNRPNQSEPWKAPVDVWIRGIYEAMKEKSARKRARRQDLESSAPPESRDAPDSETPPAS